MGEWCSSSCGEDIAWLGVPAPKWSEQSANKKLKLGSPVALFDGKDMSNWEGQHKDQELGWTIVDGAMTNAPKANNLRMPPKVIASPPLTTDNLAVLSRRCSSQTTDVFGVMDVTSRLGNIGANVFQQPDLSRAD